MRGRGSSENPKNRFERLHVEIDDAEEVSSRTQLIRDTSRTIIATNESPDVGFEASVNPYRGCENGCAYCLAGDTPVLMADGTTRPLEEVRVGDDVVGTSAGERTLVATRVVDHWRTERAAFRITLGDGRSLVASGEHRFLTPEGWKHVSRASCGRAFLTPGDRVVGELNAKTQRREDATPVTAIEPLGVVMPMYDITTGTGDFIANGVVSHNCYARPTHEFLGLSAGLDFESKIFVKEDAPVLLRRELASRRWQPKPLAFSGVTDAYQPVERRLELTRRCLEVCVEFRNPVVIITKRHLVVRDADLLADLARDGAAAVCLSITTLDADLAGALEPRASRPALRLQAIEELTAAGVPAGVLVSPIIPGLTDHEIPAILEAAARAGAAFAGHQIVRLPLTVAPLFEAWLDEHAPTRKEKVLNRLRSMRDGRLNDPRFGNRMKGSGPFAEQISSLFKISRRKAGISGGFPSLSIEAFRRPPADGQMSLFGEP